MNIGVAAMGGRADRGEPFRADPRGPALGQRLPFLWFTAAVILNTALASYYRTRS